MIEKRPPSIPDANEDMVADRIVAINVAQALGQLDGDRELLSEVIDIFVETIPELMDDLQSAISSNDAEQLQGVAHSLKGAASNICAEPVRFAAQQLEEMGQLGDFNEVETIMATLQDHVSALVTFAETIDKP